MGIKSIIKSIVNKLFNEDHDQLGAIGISVYDIAQRIERLEAGSKSEIDDIKYDIDYALEFSEVISNEEKQALERLKIQLESI